MATQEWVTDQEIESICFEDIEGQCSITVGKSGITKIEKAHKSGEYCAIPYVRVWKGDFISSEHSQHKLIGVYFFEDTTP